MAGAVPAEMDEPDRNRHRVRSSKVRRDTAPHALADNRMERATIADQIKPLRQRLKHLYSICKDVPRLLNLLKTELLHEYERKHPMKEHQIQHIRRNAPGR